MRVSYIALRQWPVARWRTVHIQGAMHPYLLKWLENHRRLNARSSLRVSLHLLHFTCSVPEHPSIFLYSLLPQTGQNLQPMLNCACCILLSGLFLSQYSKIVPIKITYLRYAVCGCCLCIKNANCYKRTTIWLNHIYSPKRMMSNGWQWEGILFMTGILSSGVKQTSTSTYFSRWNL